METPVVFTHHHCPRKKGTQRLINEEKKKKLKIKQMKKKKVNGRYKSKIVKNQMKKKKKVTFSNGEVGYRSPYLSHAKRALYHLSYIPVVISAAQFYIKHFIPRFQNVEKDKSKNHIGHFYKLKTTAQSKMPIALTTKQRTSKIIIIIIIKRKNSVYKL